MNSIQSFAVAIIGFLLFDLMKMSQGQSLAPSPAADGPTSDGAAIDQGIAYVLLMVALAITYFIH